MNKETIGGIIVLFLMGTLYFSSRPDGWFKQMLLETLKKLIPYIIFISIILVGFLIYYWFFHKDRYSY